MISEIKQCTKINALHIGRRQEKCINVLRHHSFLFNISLYFFMLLLMGWQMNVLFFNLKDVKNI